MGPYELQGLNEFFLAAEPQQVIDMKAAIKQAGDAEINTGDLQGGLSVLIFQTPQFQVAPGFWTGTRAYGVADSILLPGNISPIASVTKITRTRQGSGALTNGVYTLTPYFNPTIRYVNQSAVSIDTATGENIGSIFGSYTLTVSGAAVAGETNTIHYNLVKRLASSFNRYGYVPTETGVGMNGDWSFQLTHSILVKVG